MRKVFKIIAAVSVLSIILGSALSSFASAENVLSGKKALFVGDSIAAGWRDGDGYANGRGWATRIQKNYSVTATNAAVAGASLTPIASRTEGSGLKRIINQINRNKSGAYDYVVLQGGFNDAMGANNKPAPVDSVSPVGSMSASFNVSDFNTSTYAGALEELIYYTKQYFPNAKIGYIITYFTPLSEYGGVTANKARMKEYWDVGKQICSKWGVSYLDLFEGSTADSKSYSNDILKTNTATYFPGNGDHIHLNSAGYDVIAPYIAEWMMTIGTAAPGGDNDGPVVAKADTAALQKLVNGALTGSALDKYTAVSATNYTNAVKSGKALLSNADATQAQIDSAVALINNCYSKLTIKGQSGGNPDTTISQVDDGTVSLPEITVTQSGQTTSEQNDETGADAEIQSKKSGSNTLTIVLVITCAVILTAGGATAVILLIKKKYGTKVYGDNNADTVEVTEDEPSDSNDGE